ncbi:hypothetical protein [Gillisia marina]|uniref:hypothetical protein n=1 Tax=Gillisia marina TaxID=1167637 RepID=UPI0002D519C9|nr:hypothetical protein [Gillisia marina]
MPLFRSYVFVRLDEKDREKVFQFPGIVRYLYWLGKPAVAKDKEIQLIKDWLDNDCYAEFRVDNLYSGKKVQIKSGAFKSQEGVIKHVGSKRLSLVLDNLGCVVSVRIRELAQ